MSDQVIGKPRLSVAPNWMMSGWEELHQVGGPDDRDGGTRRTWR